MSNIRVDVGYTIKDGTEIKFRSPVDCSAITGLIVYYPEESGKTASTVFALSDAHGNNVGDIDHLFAEDVVVKVILDVTNKMAFVQNADTNAYLEAALAGKAPSSHKHSASDLTSTVPLSRGGTGTGQDLGKANKYAIIRKATSEQLYYTNVTPGVFVADAADTEAKFVEKLPLKFCNGVAPSLSDAQQTALVNLAEAYLSNKSKFVYHGSSIRNIYTDAPNYSPFDANGKIKTNCGLFVGLVWAGVAPSTFDNFNGELDMAFDWGYQFMYPYRKAHEKTNEGNVYGLIKPNDTDYVGASSYNSYYDPTVTNREDKQRFFSFATAADMAAEMFVRGFEVPLKEIQKGDILFYKARSLNDGSDDYAENFRFRNITHVAMVTSVYPNTCSVNVIESTPMLGDTSPIARCGTSSEYQLPNMLRGIYLTNHIVMAARHPAAFGVGSNIFDAKKFNVL